MEDLGSDRNFTGHIENESNKNKFLLRETDPTVSRYGPAAKQIQPSHGMVQPQKLQVSYRASNF